MPPENAKTEAKPDTKNGVAAATENEIERAHRGKEISRRSAGAILQCSSMQLVRFEEQKRLTPRKDARGRVFYPSSEVAKIARTWKPQHKNKRPIEKEYLLTNRRGEIAAIALPMFERGCSLTEICVAAASDPLIIQQLYETWLLGLDGPMRKAKREENEKREREEQRAHIKSEERRAWREWKLNLAKIEARKPPGSTGT